MSLILVQTAFEKQEEALAMAQKIIADRRAACVQVSSPAQSVYCWDGAVQRATEFILTAKVPEARARALQAWIEKNHSYDVPEVVCVSARANSAYMNWVAKVCE